MAQKSNRGGKDRIQLPVEWRNIEESPLIFSNSFLIQHTPQEFIITFAQIHPPPTFGKTVSEIKKIHSVQAKAAVRIAMSPGRLEELIEVLSENYKNYLTNYLTDQPSGAGKKE